MNQYFSVSFNFHSNYDLAAVIENSVITVATCLINQVTICIIGMRYKLSIAYLL